VGNVKVDGTYILIEHILLRNHSKVKVKEKKEGISPSFLLFRTYFCFYWNFIEIF